LTAQQTLQPWRQILQLAQQAAQQARFDNLLRLADDILATYANDGDALLHLASLLHGFGFLTRADQCLERVRTLLPNDLRPIAQLASLATDMGNHEESVGLYRLLLQYLPDNPVVRRNMLCSLEYAPQATVQGRVRQAQEWGEWAMERAGGLRLTLPRFHVQQEI